MRNVIVIMNKPRRIPIKHHINAIGGSSLAASEKSKPNFFHLFPLKIDPLCCIDKACVLSPLIPPNAEVEVV
jgi:hypothetical protein